MESTLHEEQSMKLQVEAKLLQLEKEHSMLDCDYKQAQHKLDELQAQKEKLSDEVGFTHYSVKEKIIIITLLFVCVFVSYFTKTPP